MVQYVLENVLLLAMSQAVRYLKHPAYAPRDKQLLRRELATDLVNNQLHSSTTPTVFGCLFFVVITCIVNTFEGCRFC